MSVIYNVLIRFFFAIIKKTDSNATTTHAFLVVRISIRTPCLITLWSRGGMDHLSSFVGIHDVFYFTFLISLVERHRRVSGSFLCPFTFFS
jgi:hypothetical protein